MPPEFPAPDFDDEQARATASRFFAKTMAGRDEVPARRIPLARGARNLLLIVDTTRSGGDWVSMVAGATLADLRELEQRGLIASSLPGTAPGEFDSTMPMPLGAEEVQAASEQRMPLHRALDRISFSTLYERITADAKPRLGLLRGYRVVLEIERCVGADAMRAFAIRYVELVRSRVGPEAAQAVAQMLTEPER